MGEHDGDECIIIKRGTEVVGYKSTQYCRTTSDLLIVKLGDTEMIIEPEGESTDPEIWTI